MAMTNVTAQQLKVPVAREATPPVRVSRVTFAHEAPPAGARRRFTQPRSAAALEEDVAAESVASALERPERGEDLFIAWVAEGSPGQNRERARAALGGPERVDASRTITLEHGSEALEWRPGHAIVQCREESRGDIVSAIIDFSFYEASLRALEQSIEAAEVQAQSDVALAHKVRYRDKKHWDRLTACSEQCSRMRLTYARLEPQLLAASRTLPLPARSWMTRLLQKSDMESRLESVSDRLEALEDLYEGAAQRISEYRWYVGGHALEIGIIVLLVIECSLMSTDIYFHNRDRQAPEGRAPASEVRRD
jgi:hypothetical protein